MKKSTIFFVLHKLHNYGPLRATPWAEWQEIGVVKHTIGAVNVWLTVITYDPRLSSFIILPTGQACGVDLEYFLRISRFQ